MPARPLPDFYKVIEYNTDGIPVAGTGGDAVTIADGANATQGAKADAAVTNPALSASEIALLKGLVTLLTKGPQLAAQSLPVTLATDGQFVSSIGALTEVAPTTDTASSGVNGRLQRIAQRLTSFLGIGASAPQVQGANATASGTAAILNADIVASMDVSAYRSVAIQLSGFGSATISPQLSLDGGATWVTIQGQGTAGAATSGITTTGIFIFALPAAGLFRLRATVYASGTIAGNVFFSAFPPAFSVVNGSGNFSTIGTITPGDALANPTTANNSNSLNDSWDGTQWVRQREAVLFATATATASGDTAVVTFSSAKKGRILAYQIEITADAATAGGAAIDIVLRDVTAAIGMGFSVFVPAVAGTAFGNSVSTGWRTLGRLGKLVAATNTALNVNLSAGLTSGKVRVNIAYTEE